MSKIVTLNIDSEIYQRLENHFKNDEQGLKQFINEAIQERLSELPPDPQPSEKDDLESYLKKGSPGSRTYGIKGQGW
jgi:hypothetical protein